jgi:photosystem II stability/assembly factor-like uncharacterized protein
MKFLYLIFLILLMSSSNIISEWNMVYKHYPGNQGLAQWDLDCEDSLNCISVAQGILLKTTDGGYNWFVQFADTTIEIYNKEGQWIGFVPPKFKPARCIDYVTSDFVVVGHQEGQITISKDGGITWDSVQLETSRDLQKIQFIDEKYGVAFGGYKTLFKTYNSGKDWEEINLNYFEGIHKDSGSSEINVDLVGKDSLIVVIYNWVDTTHKFYTIHRTFDGGQTWEMGTKIPRYSDYEPFFLSMDEGWLAGSIGAGNQQFYDVIFYTSDGGQTWDSQMDTLLLPYHGLNGIYFSNNDDGIAWGGGNKLWLTSNGGKNWFRDPHTNPITNNQFNKIVFPTNNFNKRIANTTLAGSIWLYEDLTSVNENEVNVNNIYPNPSSDFITIQFQTSEVLKNSEVYHVQIFDMLGIEIMSVGIGLDLSTQRIDVSHLPAGVYFIRIGTRVEKFVKM